MIADRRNAALHWFGSDGAPRAYIGRRGDGPGEFRTGPTTVRADGDSAVVVDGGFVIQRFLLHSREEVLRRPTPYGAGFGHIMAARAGRVYFAHVDRNARTTVGFVSTPSDSAVYGGPFPDPLPRSQLIADYLSFSQLAVLGGDSVALVLQSSEYVFLGPFKGPFDSLRVPVVRRRGTRPDILAGLIAGQVGSESPLTKLTMPSLLSRLPSGELVYVGFDAELVSHNRFAGTMYVSVVDPAGRRACVDAPIAAPTDPPPWAALAADTLVVLVQEVADDRVWTVVRKYQIQTDHCQWLATDYGRAH